MEAHITHKWRGLDSWRCLPSNAKAVPYVGAGRAYVKYYIHANKKKHTDKVTSFARCHLQRKRSQSLKHFIGAWYTFMYGASNSAATPSKQVTRSGVRTDSRQDAHSCSGAPLWLMTSASD